MQMLPDPQVCSMDCCSDLCLTQDDLAWLNALHLKVIFCGHWCRQFCLSPVRQVIPASTPSNTHNATTRWCLREWSECSNSDFGHAQGAQGLLRGRPHPARSKLQAPKHTCNAPLWKDGQHGQHLNGISHTSNPKTWCTMWQSMLCWARLSVDYFNSSSGVQLHVWINVWLWTHAPLLVIAWGVLSQSASGIDRSETGLRFDEQMSHGLRHGIWWQSGPITLDLNRSIIWKNIYQTLFLAASLYRITIHADLVLFFWSQGHPCIYR